MKRPPKPVPLPPPPRQVEREGPIERVAFWFVVVLYAILMAACLAMAAFVLMGLTRV